MITKSKPKDLDEQRKLSSVESYNKSDIFLGFIDYELNSLLGASQIVDYIYQFIFDSTLKDIC